MKEVNYTDSANDVVDTIGPVLATFLDDVIKTELSDAKYVFDPNLDYETAIKRFREDSQMNFEIAQALPLFVFRRSVLRWPDDGVAPNRRFTSSKALVKDLVDGSAMIYTPIYGEFDLEFSYINKNIEDIERFEITYLSDEGISGTREFELDLPDLGTFKYYAEYNELQSLDINYENNYFKALVGTIKIRGMFFTFRSQSKIIKNIQLNYRQWLNSVSLVDQPIIESHEIGEL
jgi:hypothetical protein